MIQVTRLNGQTIVVNSDLIEQVESTPDTVMTLTTGRSIIVCETIDEIIDKVTNFRVGIAQGSTERQQSFEKESSSG